MPPLNEQRRIVAKLDALQERREAAKEAHAFTRCEVADHNDEVFKRYQGIDGGDNKFKQEIVYRERYA